MSEPADNPTRKQRYPNPMRGVKAAGVLVIIFIIAVLLASLDDATSKPGTISGDTLGQDSSESFAQYRQRAMQSLEEAPDEQPVYSMITFTTAQDCHVVGEISQRLNRVGALFPTGTPPLAVPEPVAGENREDVCAREIRRAHDRAAAQGVGAELPEELANTAIGMIAYATGEQLREAATDSRVVTVEALPADAHWGHFGLRPVYPEAEGAGE